jgi:UDP:flavonoid glycosyltransferase YjiC (YdhE family)
VVPSFADQFFWADRVRRSGIGLVSRVDASSEDLGRQLRAVVGEGFVHRAAALAAGMRTEDGTRVAAEMLERLEASPGLPPRHRA